MCKFPFIFLLLCLISRVRTLEEDESNLILDLPEVDEIMDEIFDLDDVLDDRDVRSKRFNMEFNGMQVTYPTYLRLTRLQAKVLRLQEMIRLLHARYTQEQLNQLPQYARLMGIYQSLSPLLPQEGRNSQVNAPNKRSPFVGVDFMGMRVSYPQYLRLMKLQEKVIKLDIIIRTVSARIPRKELEQIPKWHTLVSLHRSLKKLLPAEYLAQFPNGRPDLEDDDDDDQDATDLLRTVKKRSMMTVDFNGMSVSLPEYSRLMSLRRKAQKLDAVMRQMVNQLGSAKLENQPDWQRLLALRLAIQKLLPEQEQDFRTKRGLTVDFNGIQVSYPTFIRLNAMQEKVRNLDRIMDRIRSDKTPEELAHYPPWIKLQELRDSLANLLPKPEERR